MQDSVLPTSCSSTRKHIWLPGQEGYLLRGHMELLHLGTMSMRRKGKEFANSFPLPSCIGQSWPAFLVLYWGLRAAWVTEPQGARQTREQVYLSDALKVQVGG